MSVSKKVITRIGSVAVIVATILAFTLPANAENLPRTQTIWSQLTGNGGVSVYPYIWSNQSMAVDFESKDFSNIEYVYFNLSYDANVEGGRRGVEGSFIPSNFEKDYRYYNGTPYIRKEFNFGTCSKSVCNYDANPRNIKLTVNTKMKSGNVSQYTKLINIRVPWSN